MSDALPIDAADEALRTRIVDFLGAVVGEHAADGRDLDALAAVARLLRLEESANWPLPEDGEAWICLVLEGVMVVRGNAATSLLALAEGSGFALPARRRKGDGLIVKALDAGSLLLVAESDYPADTASLPSFAEMLTSLDAVGVDRQSELQDDAADEVVAEQRPMLHTPIGEVMTARPFALPPEATIRDAASLMAEKRISCLPIVQGDHRLVGIVTEADITARVVAAGHDSAEALATIMSDKPLTLGPGDTLVDLTRLLSQYRIAHVPVVKGGRLVGIITQTDIVRQQSSSVVHINAEIARLDSADAIAGITAETPRLLAHLVDSGSSAMEIGHVMTSVTDAVTKRVIALALEDLGEPPVPFAWLACGSQGRREQTSVTDQDNCIIIDDRFDKTQHGEWFARFAERVCTDLDTTGYVFCPGDMMAMNPRWCQPLRVWLDYFDGWINRPDNEAQMLASVMFDLRVIHGETGLLYSLQSASLDAASSNSIFVAHLMSNALKHRPPIGLFGQLATERRGQWRHKIDMKHGALVPIVDMARAHALSVASREVNTWERLTEPAVSEKRGVLSEDARRNLAESYEFMSMLRMRHQARQVRRGHKPDNYINPDDLGQLEREQLKYCLGIVKKLQATMQSRQGVLG
ncbi:MAG: histidine kinase [Gammaproteobacteria bacterium]|nr:MAG: histidine kinase [Gammaproteobacteria bacterium]